MNLKKITQSLLGLMPNKGGANTSSTPKLSLFKTQLGKYYLPTTISTDVIVNAMKRGEIFEPEIVEIAQKFIQPGTTVLDLGANFGQMTLLFSQFVGENGHVFSFEADDFVYSVLEKNIAVNERTNVTPIFGAVYDQPGLTLSFPKQDFKRFCSYGSYGLDPQGDSDRKVPTLTIDGLNIQNPISFMKVDIQGSDLFALRGARETILRNQMPILFEFEEQFQKEFRTSFDDYMQFVESINYRVKEVISEINYLIVPA